MTKPINFRPKNTDVPIIDALMETGDYKSASDLVRAALWQLALDRFGPGITDTVGLEIAENLQRKFTN